MKERGVLIVELCLVIAVLVILLFKVVDIMFLYEKPYNMAIITREAGLEAYRRCSTIEQKKEAEECLEKSLSNVVLFTKNNGNRVVDADLVVRLWKVIPNKKSKLVGQFKIGNSKSRYTPKKVATLKSYNYSLRDSIVTVEVFLDPNTNMPFFNRNLYESAVF